MNHKKLLPQMIGLTLVLLLLVACGGTPQPTPTSTLIPPTATPTPVPPTLAPTPVPPTLAPTPVPPTDTPTPVPPTDTPTPVPPTDTPTPVPPTDTPTPVPPTDTPKPSVSHIPLLETNWGQRNEYARFSPDNLRLGCWSTAIAQILYFHRLRPSGSVSYQCTTGYSINENLNSYTFDWNLFVNEFDNSTPEASINEVARYVYFTSVVIQKDFGTGSYTLSHSERPAAVADHYNCKAQLYDNRSYSLDQIKQVIVQEIDAHRPVMMHLRDLSHNSYHAVTIDAYRIENGEFWVHINMGHEGSDNGWYNFDSPVLHYDDNSYRKIMTIKPIDH